MPEPLPHDDHLLGLHVTAHSPRKTYDGVVLPPPARSRTGRMRLALDDGRTLRLDPDWTVEPHRDLTRDRRGKILALTQRVAGSPSYRHGDLPARHLATQTMLRREHRAQPAPGQPILAWYRLYKDWAALYAVADAANLAPLSPARDAAWHAARTCCRCGKQFGSPIAASPQPERQRYCAPCHQAAAVERWIEQVRPVQAEMAVWAREALADPRTVLAAKENPSQYGTPYHVETVPGEVLVSATVRTHHGAASDSDRWAQTTFVGDLVDQILGLGGRRIIGWYGGELTYLPSGMYRLVDEGVPVPTLHGAESDRLIERYSLWCGDSAAYRSGFWYQAPRLPWNWSTRSELNAGYRTAQTATDRVRWMRIYLHRMATERAPEPTVHGSAGA